MYCEIIYDMVGVAISQSSLMLLLITSSIPHAADVKNIMKRQFYGCTEKENCPSDKHQNFWRLLLQMSANQ